MENITETNQQNSNKNNIMKENIILNVTLGIICLVILIMITIHIKKRFCKKRNYNLNVDNSNLESVQRIPNPLYEINNKNVHYEVINEISEI